MTQHWKLEAAPHWHMGKHITKCPQRRCWSMEKAAKCMRESERTLLWTSANIIPAPFKGIGSFHRHQQSTEENASCFASFPSYLKAN